MEQYNQVQIRGMVGNVRTTTFPDAVMGNISVATNYMYMTRDGQPAAETTWFTVLAREGKAIEKLSMVNKGSAVQVVGRMRSRSYKDAEGIEHNVMEVVASKVEVLKETLTNGTV